MKNKFPIAALVGAVTGVVAGILTAPKSGQESRKIVKNNTTQLGKKAEHIVRGVLRKSKEKVLAVQRKAKDRIAK
jgi:gas vesicle protein